MTLTVTFKLGTDVDKAQVQVQNRVAQALPTSAGRSPRSSASPRSKAIARPNDGRASCSRRMNRYDDALSAQLRDAPGEGRARAHSPASADVTAVRFRRLRDAHLAESATRSLRAI